MSQSAEDGCMGLLSCMCRADAKSGQFYGPGSGMMAARGPAVPFELESFYDNEKTRTLLWERSTEAVGGEFSI